jgi:hypothetical protein
MIALSTQPVLMLRSFRAALPALFAQQADSPQGIWLLSTDNGKTLSLAPRHGRVRHARFLLDVESRSPFCRFEIL